jgi:Nucleotide-diphospho-sugar transferase
MMMAKVICVQLVSMLGYDFLFQDVDIIWFKNPLEYFKDPKSPAHEFDVFFQDDGGHTTRYAPYSANSGFYFVRHNDRTRHFLTSLFSAGDLILKTNSHQQALIAVLSEHVSLYGLKAKVLSREMEEFPGGYQWNMKSGKYMRAFFAGELHPYIFHMSWTLNKNNKVSNESVCISNDVLLVVLCDFRLYLCYSSFLTTHSSSHNPLHIRHLHSSLVLLHP